MHSGSLIRRRRPCLVPALLVLGLAMQAPARAAELLATHSLTAIAAAAESHARTLLQGAAYANDEVRAGALDTRLRLRECESPLETFSNNREIRGGRVTVGVRCTGAAPWTLYVPVAIAAEATIVVVQGPLPRGTLLNEQHLQIEHRALTALPPQYIGSVEEVVGRELTRAVNGATIATPAMLQLRDLVTKGQDVIILASGGKVQVRMTGVALQRGQLGERIDVKNSSSGRTVQAVIVDGATVQVQL